MVEAVVLPRARRHRDELSEPDREEVNRLIRLIELDPRIDGVHKHLLEIPSEGIRFTVYNNGIWQIAYTFLDAATIGITSIRRIRGDRPAPML